MMRRTWSLHGHARESQKERQIHTRVLAAPVVHTNISYAEAYMELPACPPKWLFCELAVTFEAHSLQAGLRL